ncbi:MAG: pantothenate kinase, type [Planctomycetota bacterium]|nr:pantothenate kinase, type [Planctomycetota bacterium]
MKWAALDPHGRLVHRTALPLDSSPTWVATLQEWGIPPESCWAIASVNSPVATLLEATLRRESAPSISWFRSAAEVPVRSTLANPSAAGADRALAVLAATALGAKQRPGLVISCGTAITVERISASHVWEGGAIAPGLGVSARALARGTAQLPLVIPRSAPRGWGEDTESALAAGVFWGMVGAVRELIRRQDEHGAESRWRLWTGGDADLLHPSIEEHRSANPIIPDLVLIGLALAAFGAVPEPLSS